LLARILSSYGQVFETVATIKQLAIENGEPLFQVDYQDPDWNNFVF
jgi:hypothetical protein